MKNNFKFLVAAFAIVALSATTASAAYMHTGLLKMGSKGSQVMELQKALNSGGFLVSTVGAGSPGMETTTFAPKTKAAVMAFQTAKGLGADGIVGAQTGTALAAMTGGSVTYPAGCSSTSGFSTTTGKPCTSTANFPAGCTSAAGYSTTTGTKCDSTTGSTNSGSLQGGAGDLNLSSTSTDVEDDVEEGKTEIVLGVEAEANDSDIAITNVKVKIESALGSGSKRIEKYIDEVTVWLGDKKVGTADADDFSKDGDIYTKSISLSGAVISEDDEEKLFVAVTALDNVDEEGQEFDITITDVRFTDATGAILSESGLTYNNQFGFLAEGEDDELSIKSSSANPDGSSLKVEDNDKSDDMLVLAFDLEVDEDSSDLEVIEFPVVITLGNTTGTINSVVSEVYVKVGSKEFDADLRSGGATTTGIYDVEFDEDFMIDAGDSEEVKVYVVFQKVSGNYLNGTTVRATVTGSDVEAEGADELNASGTASGKTHTLNTSTADVSNISWKVLEGGSGVELVFTVEAEDESVDVTLADLIAADAVTLGAGAAVAAPTLTKTSGDTTGTYTVEEGDTATFSLVYTNTGSNGSSFRVTMSTIAGQDLSDSQETSPLVVRNVNM